MVHNDPGLARATGIVTRLVHVRISRRDNNHSTRRGLGRSRRGVAERSRPCDKVTKASAIALKVEGDLASSKNAQRESARTVRRACTIASVRLMTSKVHSAFMLP